MSARRHDYKKVFNQQVQLTLSDLHALFRHYPKSIKPLLRIIRRLRPAYRLREKLFHKGVPVPPLLIVSTTDACNLKCAGCYAQRLTRPPTDLLPDDRIRELVSEASSLGVTVIMLAGGEPLLKPVWLEALASHPELAGLVFTNGTMLQDSWVDWFGRHRHVLPAISLEGGIASTDRRRGRGVYSQVRENLGLLQAAGIPFGLSITLTRENLDEIRSSAWISESVALGCRLLIFVEYVPIEDGTDDLTLTQSERLDFIRWTIDKNKEHQAHFMVFPGDEEPYGGCLASARGFAHITSGGDLEPCPFAPFSDRNLRSLSLADALRSDFLREIRDNHNLLQEGRGGCSLWHNRKWVSSLLSGMSENPDGTATPPAN